MKEAPLPSNEAERLKALASYEILDTPQEDAYDNFTWLASRLCETPVALVSLVDEYRQWFKSSCGLAAAETPREVAFCSHALLGVEILEVPDAREDERFCDNPLVTGEPHVIFYAGAPLISADGFALGTLCVIDHVPRRLTSVQRDGLKRLAAQVTTQLELRRVIKERRRGEARLALQHVVGRILMESTEIDQAMPGLLEAIAQATDHQIAAVWHVDDERQVMKCVDIWMERRLDDTGFAKATRDIDFARGVGVPGRVWKSGMPCWVPDLTLDDNFPRAPQAKVAGLHSCIATPILSDNECIGVLEFYTREVREPDAELLDVMAGIGSMVGQFIERKLVEDYLIGSEKRRSAILDAALDCIITIDQEGRVVEFNPAAEDTFGYRREEVVGKQMAELIIPPRLRDAHSKGLSNYLKTGEGPVLGQRIEVPAIRADGEEITVELAIQPIQVGARRLFTAYLRDITEQNENKASLESSYILLRAIGEAQSMFIAEVSPKRLFDRLLSLLLEVTASEYGFIGEVFWSAEDKPYLKTHAITNIAWNEETQKFYEENAPQGLEFHNLKTLFGQALVTEKPVIANSPYTDSRRGGLPEGHPALNAFLGVPLLLGDRLVGMIGIANREGGYDQALIDYLTPFLTSCANMIQAYRAEVDRKEAAERFAELTRTFIDLGTEVEDNINALTEASGHLLGGRLALYSRVDDQRLCSVGKWNTPPGFEVDDEPEGHICYEVIKRGPLGGVFHLRKLPDTVYYENDPRLGELGLQTYLGHPVQCGGKVLGSLCVLFDKDFKPDKNEQQILEILATAIGIEEDRRMAGAALAREKSQRDSILEGIGDGVIVTDLRGRVVLANHSAHVLLDLKEELEPGQPFLDVLRDMHMNESTQDAVEHGRSFARMEITLAPPVSRTVDVISTNYKDESGVEVGRIYLLRDVTREREVDRMKSEFVASVSHELRTPLASIKGFTATILRDDEMPQEVQSEFLNIINDESDRLASLIEDLLDLSRIESGGVGVDLAPTNVVEACRQVVEVLKPQFEKRNVLLETDWDAEPTVSADRDRLGRLVQNLLGNAMKFTPEGGRASIRVFLENGCPAFQISDSGVGIPAEDLSSIFDRFYRVRRKGKQPPGTGLGLTIVKEIVDMHGWDIRVESEKEQGTVFTVVMTVPEEGQVEQEVAS